MRNRLTKANYGIDAPSIVRNFLVIGSLFIIAIICLSPFSDSTFIKFCIGLFFIVAFICLAEGFLMIYSSKVGKYKQCAKLIDLLELNGHENVLEIGPGRGLVLIAVAKRLTTGKAVGVDLWRTIDQSGNSPEVTLANATLEGVSDKIELVTGDARHLPFENDSFDALISCLAIHNIPEREGRKKALNEALRVLKPGGKFAILDFTKTKEYVEVLQDAGVTEVSLSANQYLMFPPVRMVAGRKPEE
ncbi:class I SAM-dependent methyltransferase [Fictibacillus sp. Mic-4]|uniref:class I SAM-dependent methyltransferase n=1 Tax=Fictibacillus sp. Mic-4 TaxID=3132826 RepID=UPI003CEF9D39